MGDLYLGTEYQSLIDIFVVAHASVRRYEQNGAKCKLKELFHLLGKTQLVNKIAQRQLY